MRAHRFLTSLILLLPSLAAEDVRYVSDLGPANIRPTYEHGHLAVYDQGITVHAPDGSVLLRYRPRDGMITNAAMDSDGTVAVALESSNAPFGSIAVLKRDGTEAHRIPTGDYVPTGLCFAPDHTLWVIGGRGRDAEGDYPLLRHYSRDGRELGQYLRRSTFELGPSPVHVRIGNWSIRASADRIGIFLDGIRDQQGYWIETNFQGEETGRWRLATDATPATFTPEGAVYIKTNSGRLVLDRESGQWRPVVLAAGTLLGADAGKLVYLLDSITVSKQAPPE